MEIRIAPITVGCGGREERYFVVYPSPAPAEGPGWMLLDTDGDLVGVEGDEIPDPVNYPEEMGWVGGLRETAHAAWCAKCGKPFDVWPLENGHTALSKAEGMGWLARYGPSTRDILLPSTPVFFRGGLPAGLREQARGDLSRAMRLLADAVRKGAAEHVSRWAHARTGGAFVTAAELAASGD